MKVISRNHLPLTARRTSYGVQDGIRHTELDRVIKKRLVSVSTTATPKLAHFSPDLLILDALEHKSEALPLMLASTCIAPMREHVARLRGRKAADDSAVQDIDVSGLRRGKFYRAFILSMASLQPIVLAFRARSTDVLDSLMADLHLFDFSGCFNDVQRREEIDVPSLLVNGILLFAKARVKEVEKASLGIGCCTIFEDSCETALVRLTRP
ncbi:hypothetical protein KCU78_g21768, partial [Aureobasidium melanogenum]